MHSITAQEIQYNLDILSGKIAYPTGKRIGPKDLTPVALEFLEIFAQDIKTLEESDKKMTDQLSHELARVAGKVYDALEGKNILFKDIEVPLVAKTCISPEDLANQYDAGKVKTGLLKLPKECGIRRIKGDGHCLFRAIAFEVANAKDRTLILKRLEGLKREFPHIKKDLDAAAKILKSAKSGYEIMSDKATSDTLVSVFRKIACEYNGAHANEVKDYVNSSLVPYLQTMSDMKRAEHGGEPEMVALSKALGLTLHIYDASVQEQGTSFHSITSGNSQGIYLLYRPGHYDLLSF